jgi:VanZ family protein
MAAFKRNTLMPWILLVGWCGMIFWQSSSPLPPETPSLPGLDKLAHAAIYGLLAYLAARAFATLPRAAEARLTSAAAVLFAAFYGFTDEFHQTFVPGRSADLWDLAADLAGALAGGWLYHRRTRMRRRPDSGFLR